MNTRLILRGVLIVSVCQLLSGCIYSTSDEIEIRQLGDGSLFVRMVQYDLRSDADNTNNARRDFEKLIEDLEPPVTTPTHMEGDMVVLRRELHKRYGTLNTLTEFIVSNGFASPTMSEACSNGYLWMVCSTDEYTIATNGEECPGDDENVIVRWPTNYTCIWIKKTIRKQEEGWMLTDMYDAFLDAGWAFPWRDDDDGDSSQGDGK
jgi:hypothetical protein